MTKRALLIGINYYKTSGELRGCINDIMNVKKLLVEHLGYEEKNIVMMKDTPDDVCNIQPDAPSRDKILACIKDILLHTKKGDTFFMHYSGHGSNYTNVMTADSELDGKDELLCPVNDGYILDDELHSLIVDGIPDGAKFRGIFDCCHSGTMLDLCYKWTKDTKTTQENNCQSCIKTPKDCVTISGCMDRQTSADAYIGVVPDFDGEFAGALTWAFIKSIKEATQKGSESLEKVTWKDLVYNIRFRLITGKYEQVPQLCVSQKDVVNRPVNF